jgi:ferredoxin
MRIVVNRELCEGNARCVGVAPEVFRLDDELDTVQLLIERPAAALRDKLETAAALCPRQALTLVDD